MFAHPGDAADPMRVLVVDDSRAIRAVIRGRLDALPGVLTEGAASLSEAAALLRDDASRFTFAVLDLDLPDAANGEVVDLVRGDEIPSVVLTGSADEGRRDDVFGKGVVDYELKQQSGGLDRVVELVARIRHFRDARVLVVDDSVSFREYVMALLEDRCYRTLGAATGAEGLDLLAAHPETALVVIDYKMPGMDGLDVVQEMRRLRGRETLSIIGISGSGCDQATVQFLKNGANDFIAKPFGVQEFYTRIDQNLDVLRLIQDAREAANRDYLTRLYNRRYFFEAGAAMYANAVRGNLQIGVAVLDLDHFKSVNDTYGHEAGDRVLVEVARALERTLRKTDLVARFGGEEFVCLLSLKASAEGEEEAEAACERIRRAIERLEIEIDGTRLTVSASIGVTTSLTDSLEGMLSLADQAVYAAKAGGRNQVALR